MNCKSCGRRIEDNSAYCNWCGAKQIKTRRRRSISVPEPRQLPSGTWYVRFMSNGERSFVTDVTKEQCRAKAVALKAKLIEMKRAPSKLSLEDACRSYISDRTSVLSPSTVNGYNTILSTRFQKWLSVDVWSEPNWQSMINEEALLCSPKTLKNAWGLVSTVLSSLGIDYGQVRLPQVVRRETPWLDYEQITTFLEAMKDRPGEMAALLALHSLRKSEILGLTADDIDIESGIISVRGSAVIGPGNKLVYKETNKNLSSRRDVPIVIPRLKDLLSAACDEHPDGPLITCNPNTMHGQINAVCERAGLPLTGLHGLRRSFASLAYHLGWSELETMRMGGWSDYRTMRDYYTKLAQKDMSRSVRRMKSFYVKHAKIASKITSKNSKPQ